MFHLQSISDVNDLEAVKNFAGSNAVAKNLHQ